MANLKLFLIAILAMPACNAIAQTTNTVDSSPHSTFIERGEKRTIAWNDMVGRIVDVDGLAWGAFDKGLGSHLVLPHGKVYLKNPDFLNSDQNGNLVRVTGVLRKSRIDAAPKGAQGYSQPFEYYTLDVVEITRIEKLELDQDRNLKEYLLALRAPTDGSTTKSYLVSDGLVLVYSILDGRIATVSKIKLNNPGKVDDEWIRLKGFKLPPIKGSPDNKAVNRSHR
jgi:hypothetical protein